MLDIFEDYLRCQGYKYSRIDDEMLVGVFSSF